MDQFALSEAHQATQLLMDSTHRSRNRSFDRRTEDFLAFNTGFKMCQYRNILVNSSNIGEAFNITNDGVPRSWLLLNIQSTIYIFFNRELLAEAEHM